MKMYNATVEVARHGSAELDADALMTALDAYHPAVGTSARGWLEARISLPAENLTQACITATSVVEAAAGAGAIACEVMTEEEWGAREGFTAEPDLVSAMEAAEILGISRERVRQLAAAGRLQEVPWEGRSRAFTRSSVHALLQVERTPGRPRKA